MGPSLMSRSLAVCPIPIIQGAITLGVMQMLFANGWLSILGFSVWALQSLTHHRWRLPHDHPALRLRAVQATGLCASIAPLQPSRSRHSNYWNCLWVRVQFIDATIPLKIYATTCTRFHTNLTIIATNIWLIDARNYWTLKKKIYRTFALNSTYFKLSAIKTTHNKWILLHSSLIKWIVRNSVVWSSFHLM